MHDYNNWESLVVPFAEVLYKMRGQSSEVLGKIDGLRLKIRDCLLNGNTCLVELRQNLGDCEHIRGF